MLFIAAPNATATTLQTTQATIPVCATAIWNQTFSIIAGSSGNIGASQSLLQYPHNVYIDIYGNLYVSDCNNHRIQRYPRGSMFANTVAGITGSAGSSYSQLYYPTSIYVDSNSTMYISDWTNCRILRWALGDPLGSIVAGGNGCGGALTQIYNSYGLFVDNQHNIYISDYQNHRVVKWFASNTTSGILLAGGYGAGSTADKLNHPWGIYVDSNQGIYIVDHSNHRVQFWAYGSLLGVTVAGITGNSGPWSYQFTNPTAITFDPYGYMYVLDTGNSRVQKWFPGAAYGQTVAAAVSMTTAYGLQIDHSGNIIVCDTYNQRVISFGITCPASTTTTTAPPTTPITQLCSTATWNTTLTLLAGLSGTGGTSTILLNYPANIYFDGYRNLYVVDTANHRIQFFTPGSFIGSTVAGNSGAAGSGYSELNRPHAIYVDANRTMYILDTSNYRILKWRLGEPLGYVIVGNQAAGSGLNQISTSYAMFVDNQYNIYVSDSGNSRVVKWLATNTTAGILVAGGNGAGSTPDKLNNPWGLYVDSNQAVYIVDRNNHRVQLWNNGVISGVTVAGTTGISGPWSFQLNSPTSVMLDPAGFMYILDSGNGRILKWSPGALYGITILTGSFSTPLGMQLDRFNNLVVADTNNYRIVSFGLLCSSATTTTAPPPTSTTFQICATAVWNQVFSTLAGSSGNRGSSTTLLYNPSDMTFDSYQNLYVVDTANHRIQKFNSGSSVGTTAIGTGSAGSSYSELNSPSAIYIDANRTMFILDTSNYRVLKWKLEEPLGIIVAGSQTAGSGLNQITTSYAMFVDNQYNVYVSEYGNHRVTMWLATNTTAGILVAGGNGAGSASNKLNYPWGVYVDVNGTIYVVDRNNHRVQRWNSGAMTGTTVGGSTADPGPYSYQFSSPTAIAFDIFGYMYILDSGNSRVQRWLPGATYGITIAATSMSTPYGMKIGPLGNIVIADTFNYRILSFALTCPSVTTTTPLPPFQATVPVCATAIWNQTFSTLVGSMGTAGSSPTLLYNPSSIAFDGYRNMYITDISNHRIQLYAPGSNIGTTIAGVTSSPGSSRSQLNSPYGLQVTSNGTMFILDTSNYRVLQWQTGEPMGYVMAGGNGNGAALTQIGVSYALFVDVQYNIYISESSNNRITKWSPSNSTVGALVAGGNGAGNTADKLSNPWGIYVTNQSTYIADRSNHRIQKWDFGASLATTVAGSTSDPGAWSYQFNNPVAITFDPSGYMYILDSANNRIVQWYPNAPYGITVVSATMSTPLSMNFDPLGNIIISDTSYYRVISFNIMCPSATTTTTPLPTQTAIPVCRTAFWNQTYSTLAGSMGTAGTTSTLLYNPYDVQFDGYGNMYVVDCSNHRIQRFPSGSNAGVTIAGSSGSAGSSRSQLYNPSKIFVSPNQTMYILDTTNYRVLKWTVGDTLGYVVAGGNGNGGAFTQIGVSYGIFVDAQYNIYISEQSNHRVTKWLNGNTTAGVLVAGGNGAGSTADKLNSPWGVYVNVNGTIFVVDCGNHRVQTWNPGNKTFIFIACYLMSETYYHTKGASVGSTVAGSTSNPGSWSYQFNSPTSITFDPYGYMYVVDYNNARIQRWYPGASYGTTVASGTMNLPIGLRFDRLGNLVIADTSNQRIISYSLVCPASTTTTISPTPQSRIPLCSTAVWNATATTVAGAISSAGSTSTLLSSPYDVQFDGYGYMYVVDYNNHRIQRFQSGSNVGTTVAGFNLASGSGRSELYNPSAIYVDSTEAMYILDTYNYRVLKWQVGDPIGTTIVNGRGSGSTLDKIGRSNGFFVDTNYNIYVSEFGNNRITKWINGNNTAGSLVAGGNGAGSTPDKLNSPWGIYVDNTSGIYIVDQGNHRVQYWPSGASVATTVAGTTSSPGAWPYQLNAPSTIMADPYGFIYVLDTGNARVQKWYPGNSYGITILSATMNSPIGMSLDFSGNLFIADTSYYRIISFRMTCLTSTTTAAPQPTQPIIQLCATAIWNQTYSLATGSTSTIGSSGTLLYNPYDVAFDGYQNMYVVDTSNHRIQFFQSGSSNGITIAGSTGSAGSTMSQLYNPFAIHVDTNGTMYILDAYNYRILRWQPGVPIGFVVAGGHGSGTTLDKIGLSYGLFVDNQYNIYVSDTGNNRVIKWAAGNTTAGLLVAGGNGAGSTADKLNGPFGIYIDSTNAVFVVDRSNHRVQRWNSGSISGTTVAGTTGSAGPWSYQFSSPTSIAFDQYGYMYILDQGNNRVQKWFPGATYGTTVISASMSSPYGMRMDRLGNFFIADTSYQRILSFSLLCPPATTSPPPSTTQMSIPLCQTATWNSTYIQIAGATSFPGSTQYLLSSPYDVAVDVYQNTYVVDYNNHRIQRFQLASIAATTVAGVSNTAGTGFSELYYPTAIHVDSNGLMYILDSYNYRVLLWQVGDPLGTVIVGGRGSGTTFDKIALSYGLYVDIQYNVYVSEKANNRVTKWFYGNTTAGILVAGGSVAGNTADKLNAPWGVYVDSGNSLYVVDCGNHRVQRWAMGAAAGVTIAGSTSNPGPWAYQFNNPTTITMDPFGYIFILDSGNSRVQKWYPGGSFGITVLSATLNGAIGMHVDPIGRLFVTDTGNQRILAFPVSCPATTTTTLAPPTLTTTLRCLTAVWSSNATLITGSTALAGSTATFVSSPYGVSFDGYGYMYVADTGNHRIQKYLPGSNIGNTVAGVTSSAGSSLAQLNSPSAVQFDSTGTMYILDTSNYRVLTWVLGDPFGTVVVNGRGAGTTLDKIGVSYSIFVDSQSNIYVSEYGNYRVTKWIAGNNTIGQLVAGTSILGSTADKLNCPMGIYVDTNNAVYVADRSNHRIQKWPAGAAVGTTVAGQSSVSGTWSYQLNLPTAIIFDQHGYMYVMDAGNSRIQRWLPGMTYGVTVVASTVSTPYGINFDFAGNIIVADTSNHRIIAFSITCPNPTTVTAPFPTLPPNLACQTGVFNTSWSIVAGTSPTAGSSSVYLNNPMDVYVDGNQNIFVADYSNSRIQRFPPAGTSIGAPTGTTVAGFTQAGGSGYSELFNPTAIFIDLNGIMYIADYSNYRIQQWLPNQPVGFTVAGGHGNGAALGQIGAVYAIFIDASGDIYVSDNSNHRVTLWYTSNTTAGQLVAGTGTAGTALNQLNGPWGAVTGILIAGTTATSGSTAALLNLPTAIVLDTMNYLYVMDAGNNRVQRFAPGASLGDTMASMAFSNPRGMRIDSVGNLFIADMSNHRIISFRCVYNVSTTTITTSTTTSATTTSSTSTSTTSTTSTTGLSTTTTTTTAMVTILTTSLSTSVTVLTGSTTTIIGTTTAGGVTTSAGGVTTTVGSVTTTAGGVTTTAGGVTTTAGGVTTTAGGVTTTVSGVTTTVAGATTTAGGVTTTAGGVTTTVSGVTTTVAGATTTAVGVTTTIATGGTTTVGIGATTITTGSVGNTAGQAASNTGSGSSQSSSNISMIAAGVAGGIVALAGLFGGIAFIVTKTLLKPSSSVSTNIATSQKTFTTKPPQHPTNPATNSNSSSKTTPGPNNSSKTGNYSNSTSNNETGPQLTTQLNIAPKIYNVTRIT
ncbi:unnamed protein product [Rotaria magnacalcarata]|uniref:NHL repeat containing protein n=2 Tax=Rotaria magnacalcarata TaxID=392030 RepID=A0A8S2JG32_9BILA|nr:unnamed protein product [Rotaria magnacalcarata]